MADPRKPTRDEIARVVGDNPRLIRAFEQLFDYVPDGIVDSSTEAATVTVKVNQLNAQLSVIQGLLELLVLAPPRVDIESDDILPTAQALSYTDTIEPVALNIANDAIVVAGAPELLETLADVAAFGAASGDIIKKDATTGKWVNSDTVDLGLTDNTTNLIASSAALSNGAAAAVGTLNNAPAAGDPTKWVAIDDNGTTRYIPAW